jgi:predicted nucleic acid-binding protein
VILLLDNTVLSNFVLVNQVELLSVALGNEIATTTQVAAEFRSGVARGRLPETKLDWLAVLELSPEELNLFHELLKRVNAGEAACLALAAHRGGRVLTDDRDARKLAAQMQIPVSGTVGVLLRLVQTDVLTLSAANEILGRMIANGYRSPVSKLDDL